MWPESQSTRRLLELCDPVAVIAGWFDRCAVTAATRLADQAGVQRANAQCGAVTLSQRFGSALNLNVHFHMRWLDGVYEEKVVTLPDAAGPLEGDAGKVVGFSLHAGVAAKARESQKLERLCRYIARPAISVKRLSISPQGRVRYELKTPWQNGTTHVDSNERNEIRSFAFSSPRMLSQRHT